MNRWIELLADHMVQLYSRTPLGHAARLNGLDRDEATALCRILREELDAAWDIMVVASEASIAEEVNLDSAIERRNDKRRNRLFIVPVALVAEAAASLADTEAHEVTEYLRPITRRLTQGLPPIVRNLAEAAMKGVPLSARLDYLCALSQQPTAQVAGLELWRIGLIPDLSPTVERLTKNRDCVVKLTDDRKASILLHQRVEALGIQDVNLQELLIKFLRKMNSADDGRWLQRIANEPEHSLTFDNWAFEETRDALLSSIDVHSFVDPKKDRPYNWSGLSLEEGTLRCSTLKANTKVTVHWSTEPAVPMGSPIFEIAVETSDSQPVQLLTDTQRNRGKKTQSWSFRPSDVEGTEDGALRVRVVIRCYVDGQPDPVCGESDEFLLVNDVVEAPHTSAFQLTRSIPDFFLERAAHARNTPIVTRCEVLPGQGVKVELDERQRRRIVVHPVFSKLERDILENPTKGGAFRLPVSSETRWGPDQLVWCSPSGGLERVKSMDWWRTRRLLFSKMAKDHDGLCVVEACELANYAEDIIAYCRGYAKVLEETLKEKDQAKDRLQLLSDLVQLDTVQLWQGDEQKGDRGLQVLGALVSPLHPMRLLWHLGHELLIREWIRSFLDRTRKAQLPKAQASQQLDGSNSPAFLSFGESLMYHADSPFFHWPLYIGAEVDDPHRIASMVRWGLGLGTLDMLTIGQELAAEKLSERLATYSELHPYTYTLKVNALNAGDGQLLVKALSSLDEPFQLESDGDYANGSARPERAYEVRLYGPSPIHRIGTFLDECARERRLGRGLSQKLDRLFRPGGSFLRPHLFWAKRELREIEEGSATPMEEAHISFVTEYFRPQEALVTEERGSPTTCASTFGLQIDLTDDFADNTETMGWVRTVRLPETTNLGIHPSDKQLTKELLRLHRLLLRASARLIGGTDDQWPATKIPVATKQLNLFAKLHEISDWVLTVDRNIGVDLFDNPLGTLSDLKENAKRYLIDYAPDRVGNAGQQLMISTSWLEEISGILRETLKEMLIAPTDLACEEVLKLLKSVSGRMVMRVARYPEVAKEAVSLAVVREVLRGQGGLDDAFLVPVDEHIPVLASTRENGEDGGERRPDLLLVRPGREKKSVLAIEIIEVKYRRHRSMAYDKGLWSDMLQATQAGEASLRNNYFPDNPSIQLDLPIRRRELKVVLAFYARRAIRHGLVDAERAVKLLESLDNLQRADIALHVRHRGFVYCPELSFETEDHEYDAMKITMIGRGALPRYTSFHPSEPAVVPVVRAPEEEPLSSPPALASSQSLPHTVSISAFQPVHTGGTAGGQPLDPSESAHTNGPRVLLGHSTQKEQEVWFTPSVRGNPHMLMVGIPGMGKTTALLNICRALSQQGIFPFVIDFHGDIASGLLSDAGGQQCQVLDAALGLPFNPLQIDPNRRLTERGWRVHYFEVAEILANLYPSFGELQVGILRDSLCQTYEAAGFAKSPHDASPPLFREEFSHKVFPPVGGGNRNDS